MKVHTQTNGESSKAMGDFPFACILAHCPVSTYYLNAFIQCKSALDCLAVSNKTIIFARGTHKECTTMKYPIGIQNFEKLRTNGYVYVDKTDVMYKLISESNYYFFSRPRRFGKSLLISTLEAFFQGKRELFRGLAVEQLETEWKEYPILHMDLNVGEYKNVDSLYAKLDSYLREWEALYGGDPTLPEPGQRFEKVIKAAAQKTGQRVVILVDEYDKPLLQAIDNEKLKDDFRNILKSFYSTMKSTDGYIKFGFLTGVTKFSKVSVFSDLNNLTDISMDYRYQTLCGITEKEMLKYFGEGIASLAKRYKLTEEEMVASLRNRYDGYHFAEEGDGVYNPFSLLNTFSKNRLGSYWFETGTPTYFASLLKRDTFRLPNLENVQVYGQVLSSVGSVDQSPLPIIYQSGYLTIKDYDPEFDVYTLGFPNKEVEEGIMMFLLPYYTNVSEENLRSPFFIANFVRDLETGKPEDFMKRMQTFFADGDYRIAGDSEFYFQNVFFILVKLLGAYTRVERDTSEGRIDMTAITKDYIYLFEFKLDKSAADALQQIEDRHYADAFAADTRKLYKIGVNFSLERRCIDDWKVE